MSRVRFDEPRVTQFLNGCSDRFRLRFYSVIEQIAQKLDRRKVEELALAAYRHDALTIADPIDDTRCSSSSSRRRVA
jgi:hypothetical protein